MSFQRYLKTNNLQLIACKSVCKTLTVSQWIVKIEIRHRYHTLLLKAKGVKWITTSRQLPYKDITISPSFYGFTRVVVRECRLMLLCYLDQDFAVITISISTTTRHPMTSAVYGYDRYCPSLVGGEIVVYNQIGICCTRHVALCVSGLSTYCERATLIDRKLEKFKLIFKKQTNKLTNNV